MADGLHTLRFAIRNARIVGPESDFTGFVEVRGEAFAEVSAGDGGPAAAADWDGDLLIPGLIDIHTDNLEKHFMPRPNAYWDAAGAAFAHDGQMATAGVTTVFDSLSLHGRKGAFDRSEALARMIGGINRAEEAGRLRADHLLHLRCEVSNPELLDLLAPWLDNPRLKLLSLMDHTPGQRQHGSMETWRAKQRKAGKTDAEIDAQLKDALAWRDAEGAEARRAEVARLALSRGIAVAAHDDASPEHVEAAADIGCTIAEFPLTLDAARAAHARGMVNVMGGPNFVRGGSHSGNASARDVAGAGLLDALCSDYVPLSMIRAAFLLTEAPFGWPLARAIATVTSAPALMTGLDDRGEIVAGKRADFLRVAYRAGAWPVIREVWRAGARVA